MAWLAEGGRGSRHMTLDDAEEELGVVMCTLRWEYLAAWSLDFLWRQSIAEFVLLINSENTEIVQLHGRFEKAKYTLWLSSTGATTSSNNQARPLTGSHGTSNVIWRERWTPYDLRVVFCLISGKRLPFCGRVRRNRNLHVACHS